LIETPQVKVMRENLDYHTQNLDFTA